RRAAGLWGERPVLAPELPAVIGEVGVSPRDDDAVWQVLFPVLAERGLRDDLHAIGGYHREPPGGDGERRGADICRAVQDLYRRAAGAHGDEHLLANAGIACWRLDAEAVRL